MELLGRGGKETLRREPGLIYSSSKKEARSIRTTVLSGRKTDREGNKASHRHEHLKRGHCTRNGTDHKELQFIGEAYSYDK